MQATESEKELVEQAVGGDAGALKLLLVRHDPLLRQRISRSIPPELGRLIDAGDILQEAYTDVFRTIGGFVPRGDDAFFRWVAKIALNRLRTMLRYHHAAKRGGGPRGPVSRVRNLEESTVALYNLLASPMKTPSRIMARREAIETVQSRISELPPRHRQAIQLVYLDGESVAAAAKLLECTDRAVHGLCRRGLKLLERRLRETLGTFSTIG